MKIRRRCKCGCDRTTKPGNKYICGHNAFGNTYRKGTGKTKIRRRCRCGCGKITNPGRKWISGHNVKGKKSEETKLKMSLGLMGNTNGKGNKGNKGKVRSEESKLKQSISNIKYDPNYEYCDVWRDCEYKSDLRKDYCENKNCKNNYKRLVTTISI